VRFALITVCLLGLGIFQLGLATNVTCNHANFDCAQLEVQGDEPAALRQLPGNPDDLAWNALPDIRYNPFEHLETDFEISEDGYYLPKRILLLIFHHTATSSDVNIFLRELDAQIIEVVPGLVDPSREIYVGITLALRVDTQSFAELEALVVQINRHPIVDIAVEYETDGPLNAAPLLTQEVRWNTDPFGDKWGLEVSRVSQLWNCNAAV
jgi:hypothetical protein